MAEKSGGQGASNPAVEQESRSLAIGRRELVVIARAETRLRATVEGVASAVGADISGLASVLAGHGATMTPLFGLREERMADRVASLPDASSLSDMANYYHVEADDEKLDELAASLAELDTVEAAYVKPPAELAVATEVADALNKKLPMVDEPPDHTPSFQVRQIYLNRAPAGVDALYAWTLPGGSGAGVRVIDCEWGWQFTHEDLLQNSMGVVVGTGLSYDADPSANTVNNSAVNHGTATIGVISGDRNTIGVTGIAPDASVGAASFASHSTSAAILQAADRLRAGDIILLEIHRAGPRFNYERRDDQQGYIAIEWWPDDFAAIQYAANRGVIVVEAAGNGSQDFDDPLYDMRPTWFPTSWRNPFNPSNASSQAILVGAGAPPPGTHGRDHGPDRSRLGFSNYGRRVDCQGWGQEVTTTGYGFLQGGSNPNEWYTDTYGGTSSASPCIVGALACMQGALRAAGRTLLTPATARSLLRTTGSPQQAAPGRPTSQRIGNRPDLRQMIDGLFAIPIRAVALYRYWNPTIGDHFYTTAWSELGGGAHGWRYEGIQCYILPTRTSGSVPLYRYWNPLNTDHFYTTSWSELGSGRHGYRYEGIQGYVQPAPIADTVPLYRYWYAARGDHFYTTSWSELGGGGGGYGYEGIQCHVFPRPVLRSDAPASEEPEAIAAGFNAPELVDAAFISHPEFALAEGAVAVTPFADKAKAIARRTDAVGPVEENDFPTTNWGTVGTTGLSHGAVSITINLGKVQAD